MRRFKVVEIGPWDMTQEPVKQIETGIDLFNILVPFDPLRIVVDDDGADDAIRYVFTMLGIFEIVNTSQLLLKPFPKVDLNKFKNTNHNRGLILIQYDDENIA